MRTFLSIVSVLACALVSNCAHGDRTGDAGPGASAGRQDARHGGDRAGADRRAEAGGARRGRVFVSPVGEPFGGASTPTLPEPLASPPKARPGLRPNYQGLKDARHHCQVVG